MLHRWVKLELNKISFLLRNAGLFDKLDSKDPTRVVLEGLPIEWDGTPEFSGEFDPRYYREEGGRWAKGKMEGKLDGKPIKIEINRTKDRFTYNVDFDGEKYRLENLKDLKTTINELHQKKSPQQDTVKDLYSKVLKSKNKILKDVEEKFLSKISNEKWIIEVEKYLEPVYVRFFIWSEDKANIESKMKESMDGILKYLQDFAAADADKLSFSYKFIKGARKAGVVIAIKLKDS